MEKLLLKCSAFATGVTLASFFGCSGNYQPKGDDSVIKVRMETVHASNAVNILEYVGIIEEKSSIALGFSVPGTIETISVSEGEIIRKGQLLAKLDPSSAVSMLVAAEAAQKQAQDAYDRLKSVHDKGSLPEIQMVDIETKLNQARSSFDLAERNLKNCSLHAPSDGVVGKKMAEAGEYSVPGKAILTILNIHLVKARISVPENEISAISSDCRSEITVSALGNRKFEGHTIEKGVMANSVSHNYPVFVTLNNPGKELLPGMVCSVKLIPVGVSTEIVVPIGIIQTTADGLTFVWLESNGTARRTFVTTGSAKGNGVEILTGLSEGDRVVTAGYQKISEGDKITGK